MPMKPYREIVYDILKKARKPMHISDLTEEVSKIRPIESKTPQNTINLACQQNIKVKRVWRGTFKAIK